MVIDQLLVLETPPADLGPFKGINKEIRRFVFNIFTKKIVVSKNLVLSLDSIESDSKNSFSRSRSIGSDPGILEIQRGQLETRTIRNESTVEGFFFRKV